MPRAFLQRSMFVTLVLGGFATVLLFTELDAELGDHHDNVSRRSLHGVSVYISIIELRTGVPLWRNAFFLLVMVSLAACSLRLRSNSTFMGVLAWTFMIQAALLVVLFQRFRHFRHAPRAHVLDGIEYVCASLGPGQLPLDSCSSVCLDQETSDGICTTGKLCQKQSVCPRQIGHKCIPSADQIVNHRCIDGACLLQNVIFDVNWTGPTNGDRLSFGCSVEWCEVQEKFVCSLELRSEKTAGTAKLPIPPMLPHECSMLSHLRNGREALPIAIPAVFTAPNACERTVSTMAVLIFVDGWNPFHQVLQTFRVLFESLATFSMDWIAPTGQQLSDCIIALSPRNTVGEIGPFGRNVLSSFCNQGILELQRSQTLCFSRLLIGTTPGGWDMSLNPEDPARVNFAGIYMGQWIKRHFGIAIVDELNVGKSSITLILRRGRRSILNEEDVVRTLACKTGDICLYSLETIDLDKATFRSTVGLFAKTAVLLGVHGAGLTNLIFMPRGGAVVELRLARSRPDYVQLCRSFGKLHFEFTKTRMVMPPSPITWPVLDDRDLLVEVSEPWELVAVVHNISSLVYHRAGACC